MTNVAWCTSLSEYIDWAITEIRNYYNTLLTIEEDNDWINLRLPQGQIPWIQEELEEWETIKEEYNDRV